MTFLTDLRREVTCGRYTGIRQACWKFIIQENNAVEKLQF